MFLEGDLIIIACFNNDQTVPLSIKEIFKAVFISEACKQIKITTNIKSHFINSHLNF